MVHGELSHPVYSATTSPTIEELDGVAFHAVEIMQAMKISAQNRPRVKSDGIIDPIQLKHQNNTFGLRYEPTLRRACNMQSETKVFVPEQISALAQGITPDTDECIR
ncbi:hypothetical protein HAX54_047281 [Datura stramonium]|uniref:Uncharacterized protein n=1 Tax=Datura stramonium TaxID=4076 RepID=A0ABS8WMU9_DATST|nr:hypothetical protein [Datura stramonium]